MAATTALDDARERFPVGSTANYWLAGKCRSAVGIVGDPWLDDERGVIYVPVQVGRGATVSFDDYPAHCLLEGLAAGPPPSQSPEEVARLARGLREDLVHLEDDDSQPAERVFSGASNRHASMLA